MNQFGVMKFQIIPIGCRYLNHQKKIINKITLTKEDYDHFVRTMKHFWKEKMEWISVKDDLPKEAGIYWVCYEINGRLKSHYCLWEEKSREYQGSKWGWRSRECVRRKNIRFWMPLPEPPKI